EKKRTRLKVHFIFAFVFFIMVLVFKFINDKLIIDFILKFAGVTYGPLLGLFAFGILTTRKLNDKLIWAVCIAAPLVVLVIDILNSPDWYGNKLHFTVGQGLHKLSTHIFHGDKIVNELILINGALTFMGLWFISGRAGEPVRKLQPA